MKAQVLALFLVACGTEATISNETAATTEGAVVTPVFGTYVEVTGVVSGEALLLSESLKTEQGPVRKIELLGGPFEDGTTVTLNGRLEGVQQDIVGVARLSGISNLSQGEPKFDGRDFYNRDGEKLQVLSYNRPLVFDAPAVIFVRDPSFGTVHVGSMGGFISPRMNPFHGFSSVGDIAKIEEQGVVSFNDAGEAINAATGNIMTEVGQIDSPGGDQFSYAWFYDAQVKTLFGLRSGGIAGIQNDVFETVQL